MEKLREDDARIAPRSHERPVGCAPCHGGKIGIVAFADLFDRGLERQEHVRPGIAVGDREDIQGIDFVSVQSEPGDTRAYSELIALAMNRSDSQRALEIANEGVQTNPDSAHLQALLASVLFESGDQRGARRALEQAEAINPDLEIVQSVRQHIEGSTAEKPDRRMRYTVRWQ